MAEKAALPGHAVAQASPCPKIFRESLVTPVAVILEAERVRFKSLAMSLRISVTVAPASASEVQFRPLTVILIIA